MQRSLLTLALAALAVGYSELAAQAHQTAVPVGAQWTVVVLYNQPKDTAAFEKYYAETHAPLFASRLKEMGVTRAELLKFSTFSDGKPAAFYREADLRWDSQEAMEKGLESDAWKSVAADIPKVAKDGFTVLIGMKTN
jgi:uncharacterized protein (TIGR02118 family)